MIEIREKFTVPATPADVYAVLSDPEAVVECVQGASLGATHEDGSIDGMMTVKFSAMRVVFKGRFKLDLEPEIMRGTVTASGKDGQGGTKFTAAASFDIASLDEGAAAQVTAAGEVVVTGRMASAIASAAGAVVRRMTAEFVEALSRRCASGPVMIGPAAVPGEAVPGEAGAGETEAGATPAGSASSPADRPAVAVLVLHGFGGSPGTLRKWGEALAEAGAAVSVPRLPGHGTRWKDLNGTGFDDWAAAADTAVTSLRAGHEEVYVMGVSLGALLALRLAETRGPDIAGLVLVNPLVTAVAGTPRWLGLAAMLRRSARAVAPNDVKKPGTQDVGYDRIALRAAASLRRSAAGVVARLAAVRQPVLLVTSSEDHVVPASDADLVAVGLTAAPVRRVRYANSYHLIPVDNDAPALFTESVSFIQARGRVKRPA
jgi:carboxylesterase